MSHLKAYVYECIKPSCKAKFPAPQKWCRVCKSDVVLKKEDDNEDVSDKHDNE